MKKILLVDDDPNILAAIERQFRKKYIVETALGADQGMTAVESGDDFAVAVVDMNMPRMNGVQFLKRLKQARPEIVRIMLTGTSDRQTAVDAVQEGAIFRYLTKPCPAETLGAAIESAIQQHQLSLEEPPRPQSPPAPPKQLGSMADLAPGIVHEINAPTQFISDNLRFLQDGFRDLHQAFSEVSALLPLIRSGQVTPETLDRVRAVITKTGLDYLATEIPKAIQQSIEGLERINRMTQAINEFYSPDGGIAKPVNLNQAIEATINLARNEWKYVADLVTELDPNLPLVPCRASEFNQVILTLILRAARAMADTPAVTQGARGTITVHTRLAEGQAEICVTDNAVGIPNSAGLSCPSSSAASAVQESVPDVSFVRAVVVEQLAGAFHCETDLERGTTFKIHLPVQLSAWELTKRP
jgi:CheY-like chemotaxis protein